MQDVIVGVTPQLPVKDVQATQEYYRDVLGFEILWAWGENDYGAVGNGQFRIHFTPMDEPPREACICIDVKDADEVYATVSQNGAKIVSDIETKPWGMREFTVLDINGHYLRIGTGVKAIKDIPEFSQG